MLFFLVAACGTQGSNTPPGTVGTAPSLFQDATETVGLDFKHENGMSGQKYFVTSWKREGSPS